MSQIQNYKNNLLNLIKVVNSQSERCDRIESISVLKINEQLGEWLDLIKKLRNWPTNYKYYSMDLLSDFAERYQKENQSGKTITVQTLFEQGWLLRHKDTWSFTVYEGKFDQIKFKDLGSDNSEILFLKKLKNSLKAGNKENFSETDIKKISKNGAMIFAVWWDSICQKGNEEEKKVWFYWWNVLNIYGVYQYTTHKKELYCSCMEYIDAIGDSTWSQYHKIIYHKFVLENWQLRNKIYTMESFEFPERPLKNVLYFNRRGDMFHSLYDIGKLEQRCFMLYRRAYADMDREERKKCCEYMRIPCLHFMVDDLAAYPMVLTDCMEDPQLFASVSVGLWLKLDNIEKKEPQLKKVLLERVNENIFFILKDGILRQQTEDWKTALKDMLWYMLTESAGYSSTVSGQQRAVSKLYSNWKQWYSGEKEIQQRCNKYILDYLRNSYDDSSNCVDKMRIGAEYLIWTDMYGGENAGEKLLEFYKKYILDCMGNKVLVSTISWSFFEENWHRRMLEYVADSGSEAIKAFGEILSPEEYVSEVNRMKGKSPLLFVGKAGLIHLYLLAEFIQKKDELLSKKNQMELEERFIDCFIGYQISDCDPFEVEHIRILNAEMLLAKYMDAICLVSEDNETRFIKFLQTQSPEKIIFYIKNIKKITLYEQLIKILKEKLDEDFTEDILFIPSMQKLIDTMLSLCYTDEKFKTIFAKKIVEIYEQLKTSMNKRNRAFVKQYKDWMKATEIQLLFIRDNISAVLELPDETVNLFYKALIYLEREAVDEIKKAEKIYTILLKSNPGNYAVNANLFISEVRICVQSSGKERKKYYILAKESLLEIKQRFNLEKIDSLLIYANALYLFEEMGEYGELWKICEEMPYKFWMDISCARYIISAYIQSNSFEKAYKLVNSLQSYYGMTDELKKLKRQIEDKKIPEMKEPAGVQYESNNVMAIIEAVKNAHCLTVIDTAKLYFRGKQVKNLVKSHLLCLMLETTSLVSQYCDYLRVNGKAASEDSYNKMIMILFNQKYEELYDYRMRDQTQEGTATDQLQNERQSVGHVDLWINHNSASMSVVEGIKITSINRANLIKHIGKIFGYSYIQAPAHFLVIYADVNDIDKTWKRYNAFLKELKDSSELYWKISKLIPREEIEVIQNNIRMEKYVCMTEHHYGDRYVNIYHIMIDIKKYPEKLQAKTVRNKR